MMEKVIDNAKYEMVRVPEGRIPVMKVTLIDADKNAIKEGYLTPFRGYRFQISDTVKGEGDRGSSYTMDLRSMVTNTSMPDYQASDMLEMFAQYTINEFIRTTLNNDDDIIIKNLDFFSLKNSDCMGCFIEETMKWLLKGIDRPVMNNHIFDADNVEWINE